MIKALAVTPALGVMTTCAELALFSLVNVIGFMASITFGRYLFIFNFAAVTVITGYPAVFTGQRKIGLAVIELFLAPGV